MVKLTGANSVKRFHETALDYMGPLFGRRTGEGVRMAQRALRLAIPEARITALCFLYWAAPRGYPRVNPKVGLDSCRATLSIAIQPSAYVSQHEVVRARLIFAAHRSLLARALRQARTGWDALGHNCWVKSWVRRIETAVMQVPTTSYTTPCCQAFKPVPIINLIPATPQPLHLAVPNMSPTLYAS